MDRNFKFDDEMVEINCFNGRFSFLTFFSQNMSFFHEKQSTVFAQQDSAFSFDVTNAFGNQT